MNDAAASEAKRALNRLRRSAEKALHELDALERAEAEECPRETYKAVRAQLAALLEFTEDEARRLQDKMLHAGGLDPGRVRRTGGG